MKSTIGVPFLVTLFFLIGATRCGAQQFDDNGWASLSLGQGLSNLEYRQDRTVWIADRKITTCSDGAVGVDMSRPSPHKNLVFFMCDESWDTNKAYIAGAGSLRLLYPFRIKDLVFARWVSWSPNESHALLASGGEGFEGPLLLVNLNTGVVKQFEYKHLGLKGETEFFDEKESSWLNENSFRMKINIVCQAFDDNPRCASGPCGQCDKGIHRTYWARVNLNPFSITYSTRLSSKAPTAVAPRPSPGAPYQASTGNDCRFCGVWKAVVGGRLMGRRPDDHAGKTGNPYCGCDYLRITKAGAGKFKLSLGSEYQGKVNWADDSDIGVNNADAIYLRPMNGKLVATFVSPNFYAMHGMDFTYKLAYELKNDNELVFSVWCSIRGGETERATYRKIGE